MSVPAEGLPPDTSPAATPPPPASPSQAPAVEAGDVTLDLDGELPADQMVFDRGYVEKLRKENQRYRTERNEVQTKLDAYDEVFGVYEPGDMKIWNQIASTWVVDPVASANMMRSIADDVLGDGTDPGGDVAAQQSLEDSMSELGDADLTPDKVQGMIDQAIAAREGAAAERAAVESVWGEMRAAGYDPDSDEGMAVLWLANHKTDGDIGEAVKLRKQGHQKIIDDYVNGVSAGSSVAPTGSGQPASQAKPITNLDDARRAADAFIRSQVGATPGE